MPASQLPLLVPRFVAAWNSHDMEAFGALFRDDAEFVNVYGAWWTGRGQIQQEHRSAHATVFRTSELTALEVRVKSLSAAVAQIHFRWALRGIRSFEGPSPDRIGVMLIVAVWDNEWQIASAQNTDVVHPKN